MPENLATELTRRDLYPDATRGSKYQGMWEYKRNIVSTPGRETDRKSEDWQRWYKDDVVLAPRVASPSRAGRSVSPSASYSVGMERTGRSRTKYSPPESRPYEGTSPLINKWEQTARSESEHNLKSKMGWKYDSQYELSRSRSPSGSYRSPAGSRPVTPINVTHPYPDSGVDTSRSRSRSPSAARSGWKASSQSLSQREQEYYRFRDHEHGKVST